MCNSCLLPIDKDLLKKGRNMTTITFDTHRAVERLIKKGIKKEQAEEIVSTVQASREVDLGNSATKADLAELKTELKIDIAQLRTEISNVKYELVKWQIGLTIAGFSIMTSIIIAILKFYLNKGL